MRTTLFAALTAMLLALAPLPGLAQEKGTIFADYDSYAAFLDEKVQKRQFGALFQSLGGANLSLAELQKLSEGAKQGFPVDFDNATVMRREELENGFGHEVRAYWSGGNYAYVYVVYHQREDSFVVVHVAMHAAPPPAMAMF